MVNRGFCSSVGFKYELNCSCFRRVVLDSVFDSLEGKERGLFPGRIDPTACRPIQPRPAPPLGCAPPRPDQPVVCPGFGFDKYLHRISLVRDSKGTPRRSFFHVSNPKPGHTTGGSGRGTRRSGQAESSKIACQHNYSPRKQKSTVPFKKSKVCRFNVSPEERTSEILCKPTEEQNQRLTRG